MGLWDGLAHATAQALAATLNEEQRQRGTALIVAKAAKPDADASDLMIMANYVVTGTDVIPEPRDDPYPHTSGDILVLGPGIFTNTVMGPAENTVINWRGENFVPQRDAFPHGPPAEEEPPDAPVFEDEHPDDPGPPEPSGGLPDIEPAEPAPMAGTHWQGRRGGQPG
jgi:hypothetical protein